MDKHEVFIGCGITEEQNRRNYEHYEEIKDKVKYISGSTGYGHHNYLVESLDPELTIDEIALWCDKGNLCFGYSGSALSDGTFRIKVYTD